MAAAERTGEELPERWSARSSLFAIRIALRFR